MVVWWFLRRGAQGHQLYVDGRRVYSADELALIGLGPLQPQVGSLCFVLRPCVLSAILDFRHETPLAPVYIYIYIYTYIYIHICVSMHTLHGDDLASFRQLRF